MKDAFSIQLMQNISHFHLSAKHIDLILLQADLLDKQRVLHADVEGIKTYFTLHSYYFRDPFVSWFRRDEETSWISFISNVGGESLSFLS